MHTQRPSIGTMTSKKARTLSFNKFSRPRGLMSLLLILGASVLVGFLAMAIFCGKECLSNVKVMMISSCYGSVLSFGLWVGNGYLSDWLTKKFPWEQKTVTRLIWGVISSVIFSGLFVAAWHYLFFVEILGNSLEWYKRVFFDNIKIALLITAIISLFLHAHDVAGTVLLWVLSELILRQNGALPS